MNRVEGVTVTTIRASCPTCGDVELTIRDVTVRVCAADNSGAYTFRCPTCEVIVAKEADGRIVDLLVSSGVTLEVWQLPAELFEPHDGDPISWDDLLDFHDQLETDGWFEALVERVGPIHRSRREPPRRSTRHWPEGVTDNVGR